MIGVHTSSGRLTIAPVVVVTVLFGACGGGVGPGEEARISGYTVSGQANGPDPVTGEQLACVFLTGGLATGGSLVGSWTGSTSITVIRSREGNSQRVTYDTTITSQEVTLTALDGGRFQFATHGVFADTLVAEIDTAYPGWSYGEWSCGPGHPLARVQEGVVLGGHWQTQPILPVE